MYLAVVLIGGGAMDFFLVTEGPAAFTLSRLCVPLGVGGVPIAAAVARAAAAICSISLNPSPALAVSLSWLSVCTLARCRYWWMNILVAGIAAYARMELFIASLFLST